MVGLPNLIIFLHFNCREPFTPGETSKEKEIQNNREKNVLSTIYFSKEATPSTPHEADPETGSSSMKSNQPAFIPLEDSEADENSEFNHQNKGITNIYFFVKSITQIDFFVKSISQIYFLREINKLVLKHLFFLML